MPQTFLPRSLIFVVLRAFLSINKEGGLISSLISDLLLTFSSLNFTDFRMRLTDFRKCSLYSGADLGFSRGGGGGFSKNFDDLFFFFFRSTKLIFRALPEHCFAPMLAKFSAPQANFLKNSQKSRFWAIFEKF